MRISDLMAKLMVIAYALAALAAVIVPGYSRPFGLSALVLTGLSWLTHKLHC